jgi:hypothetical protein
MISSRIPEVTLWNWSIDITGFDGLLLLLIRNLKFQPIERDRTDPTKTAPINILGTPIKTRVIQAARGANSLNEAINV